MRWLSNEGIHEDASYVFLNKGGKMTAARSGPKKILLRTLGARVLTIFGLSSLGLVASIFAAPSLLGAECMVTWDGGGGNNSWHTAANWSTDAVPGAADWACIPDMAPDVTVVYSSGTTSILGLDALEALSVTGGTLNMTDSANTSTVAAISHSNGTLGGAGTLSVSGSYTWSGGTMQSPGITHIEPTATISFIGISDKFLLRRLNLDGDATFSAGRIQMATNSGQPATQINTSGDFQLQGDREFIYWFGTLPQINSSGSFTKASGTGTANVNVALSNSGAASIVSGSLRLANGGTSSGSFSVPAGTTIDFGGGTHSLSTTSSIAGDGTGRFSGGTVSHSGSYLLPLTLVTGGTFNANGPFDTATINITGGALNLAGNDSVSTVTHSNGTLGGAGTLSVSGSYTWSGGTMQSPEPPASSRPPPSPSAGEPTSSCFASST